MYKALQTFFSLALFLLSAACAGPEVSESTPLAEVKDRGIVIVSITHDWETGARAQPIFYVNSASSDSTARRQLRSRPNVGGIPVRSDFSDIYGQVYVLNMEPGTHSIVGWQTMGGNLHVYPRHPPPPLNFEVKAGEVIYIGNLNMNHRSGRSLLGLPTIVGALPEIRDKQAIDLPIAERKAPIIKGRVIVRLLPLGDWFSTNTETNRQVDIPPPIPIPPTRK